MNLTQVFRSTMAAARRQQQAYAEGSDRPLGGYVAVMGAYTVAAGAVAAVMKRSGRTLPERPDWQDLALATVATYKISRLLAKAPVTSPLRAPFTRYAGPGGDAELAEEVRGSGVRHSVGELLTCPFCLSQWVAGGFAAGLVLAPRPTRWTAALFTVAAGSDVLQFLRANLEQSASD